VARRNPSPDAVAASTPPRGARKQIDWNVQARTTALESQRYTRFVGVMKRALFLAAMAVLAAVLAYSLQPRRQDKMTMVFAKLGIVNNDLAMLKPKLTGLDTEGNPYVVTAEKAIQDRKDPHKAQLIAIDADMTEKKQGTWMTLTAPTGLLDATIHKLHLNGPIAAFSDDGNEFHTMTADIDLSGGIVRGSRMIVGQGPMGNMRADRFWLNRDKHLVFLNGNVRMIIVPKAMKGPGARKPDAAKKTNTP
jgi:lipopolysaccharide export system protein LptC